jgi:S-adenosylmethionine-dependent methyltransferase
VPGQLQRRIVATGPDRHQYVSFAGAEERWISRLGQLRDIVRQELVAAQLGEVIGGGDRILDVGCGQGTQALILARAGHDVTGLDPSEDLLGRFEEQLSSEPAEVRGRVHVVRGFGEAAAELTPGPFDVVLCHGVLMYLANIREMLGALSRVAASEAVLSLLVRNGLAPAMRPGLLGQWDEAMAAFDSQDYVNRLGLRARMHTPADLDTALAPFGWRLETWFGVRVFTDHLEEAAPTKTELAQIVAAELEAGRRDPYRQVAAFLHLIYRRREFSTLR